MTNPGCQALNEDYLCHTRLKRDVWRMGFLHGGLTETMAVWEPSVTLKYTVVFKDQKLSKRR